MNAIDPEQPIPIYFQLKTLLLEEIIGGKYEPGARLPTEYELCERFSISRTPVTRALTELADEGVILRHRRRGSFVNPHWPGRRDGGREVRVLVPEGPWEELIREAAPAGVSVNVARVALPDLHQALIHAIAEGRAPDLAVVDSVWVPEFAASGFLQPLDDLDPGWVRGEYAVDFLEPFVSANRDRGATVAVQAEADVAGLWFARRALASAGVAPPATWDELVAACRRLAAGVAQPLVLPGGSRGGETTTYCLLAFLAANGAAVLGDGGVTLDDPATVEALELLRRLVDDGLVPREAVAYEWDRPIRQLAQGQAALAFGGSYDGPALAAAAGLAMRDLWDEFGFLPMPAGPRGEPAVLAGGMAYAILRQSPDPRPAVELLEHLVSPEALARMSRRTAQIPSRASAVALVAAESAFLSTTAALLGRAAVRPATPAYARVSAQV